MQIKNMLGAVISRSAEVVVNELVNVLSKRAGIKRRFCVFGCRPLVVSH